MCALQKVQVENVRDVLSKCLELVHYEVNKYFCLNGIEMNRYIRKTRTGQNDALVGLGPIYSKEERKSRSAMFREAASACCQAMIVSLQRSYIDAMTSKECLLYFQVCRDHIQA